MTYAVGGGVLGLNFELYNPKAPIGVTGNFATTPKREYANLKLRYSRLLACYTPILSFVHESDAQGVLRDKAEKILDLTPIERLTALHDNTDDQDVRLLVERVMTGYDAYLLFVSRSEEQIIGDLNEEKVRREMKDAAYEFHQAFVRLLARLGDGKPLYDYVVV